MAKDFVVTPWKVEGDIDYNRLIKEFGTEHLDDALLHRIKKLTGELHPFLRRKIFFSHRDMNWLLDEYEKGNKFYLYTGRGPSGNTHIGHLVPWLFTKWLQDKFDVLLYFQMTDDEKFLFKDNLSLTQTNSLAYENALDVIALGFKQGKTHIFTNTDYSKTLYKNALLVAKKITVSTTKAVFGFNDSNNVGELFFTSMQAVPAFLPSVLKGKNIPCLIPHAIDQDAHFRVARDVLPKLGFYKPAAIHCRFLPALGIGGKMSASEKDSAIYTTDSADEIEKKVKKYAFSGGRATIEEHRKLGGNPDIDVPYQWLSFFEEDDSKLKKIHDDYKSGKLLSGELKLILIEKLQVFLKEHQRKRESARKVLDKFILKD
ncbi:tryptophan--tRNA ligase [Candidatus Micrarchaeota archaeon]|nr:tryptophan--tRNA ligase [Candidatus Micrarchaeota archaeon]